METVNTDFWATDVSEEEGKQKKMTKVEQLGS